jgi:hypothetical protein
MAKISMFSEAICLITSASGLARVSFPTLIFIAISQIEAMLTKTLLLGLAIVWWCDFESDLLPSRN